MAEIVVGVDGSSGAARALDWALQEASLRKMRVRAVHVYDTAKIPRGEKAPADVEQRALATAR